MPILERSIGPHIYGGNFYDITGDLNINHGHNAQRAIDKLLPVPSATFKAQSGDRCMNGTRVALLETVSTWAVDPEGPRVFWLSGMAGTGKTAIALSICHLLSEKELLGASFFCARNGAAEQRNIQHIFPTLANGLAMIWPTFRDALLEEIASASSDATYFTPANQFAPLLSQPLRATTEWDERPIYTLVIDALDECEDPNTTETLLRIILHNTDFVPIKFFITSRPEPHIRQIFSAYTFPTHTVLRLHDIDTQVVQEDIKHYLEAKLNDLATLQRLDDWPHPTQLSRLASICGKFFIYACTAYKYIKSPKADARTRLQRILDSERGTSSTPVLNREIDNMYAIVLEDALMDLEEEERTDTINCLSAVIHLHGQLSATELGLLLGTGAERTQAAVAGLHSILYIQGSDGSGHISTFHASLGDYLTDPSRCGSLAWYSESGKGNTMLAHACLRIMEDQLHFNMSQSNTSYHSNIKYGDQGIISTHLAYACRHFTDHIIIADQQRQLMEIVEGLLYRKLLFWIEGMSVLGLITEASVAIKKLRMALRESSLPMTDLIAFLTDVTEYLTVFEQPITRSAPHVYISALPFMPDTSQIKQKFKASFPRIMQPCVVPGEQQTSELVATIKAVGSINAVAFSPDSLRIASGSSDNTICIWDTRTGSLVGEPLQGHTRGVTSVAFSPDGSHVVSGSWDNTLIIWNAQTGVSVGKPLKGHKGPVVSVAYAPHGMHIASASRDSTIRIWDAQTGTPVGKPFQEHALSIAYSPDGLHIVSGSADSTIRIWHSQTGMPVGEPLTGHERKVTSVAFSHDGSRLASASKDYTIRIWDPKTGSSVGEPFFGHTLWVTSVAFSPSGMQIISGSMDETLRLWDVQTGTLVREPLTGHTSSRDSTLQIWDAQTTTSTRKPVQQHTKAVASVAFSPNGLQIVSGSWDNTIRTWDTKTGRLIGEPRGGHTNSVTSVMFSPDGQYIASASRDWTIQFWDPKTSTPWGEPLKGHTNIVNSIAFSPDSRRVVSGSWDNTVRIWKVGRTNRSACKVLKGHTESVGSIAFSPDNCHIASASNDMTIRIWNAHTCMLVGEPIRGHRGAVYSVAFSPDGSKIVSGSFDHTVRIWDARTGASLIEPLKGHKSAVASVAFSPDGLRVVSGSWDDTLRIWDIQTGTLVCKPLTGHTDSVQSVAFSPDGLHVASGSRDHTIRIWDASSDPLVPLSFSQHAEHACPQSELFKTARICRAISSSSDIEDGWVIGPNNELLFWVPPHIRRGLCWPRTKVILGATMHTLDLSTFEHGAMWTRCQQVQAADNQEENTQHLVFKLRSGSGDKDIQHRIRIDLRRNRGKGTQEMDISGGG